MQSFDIQFTMITSFRKLSGNIITRMIIGTVIIAFIIWSVSDVVRQPGNNNIVEFRYIKPINLEEFRIKKKENTLLLQYKVDPKRIEMLDQDREINYITLDQMINHSLTTYFVNQYNLSISDKYFLNNIKELGIFKTELGYFNEHDFNAIISKIYLSEKHFTDSYKEYLLGNFLLNNYRNSVYVPILLQEENIKFYSELRILDIAKINLKCIKAGAQVFDPTELSLREFYSNNIAKFELPETRRIQYVEIKYTDFVNDIVVSSEDIKSYFQEHQDDFYNKTFKDSNKDIILMLQSQARSKVMNEFAKTIEDDVASGIAFEAISSKYKLNLIELKTQNCDNIKDLPDILQPFMDNIQNMEDNEVSYPMETPNGVVLFTVDQTHPRQVLPFEVVQDKVKALWVTSMIGEINYQTLAELKKSANYDEFHQKSQEHGIDLTKDMRVWRDNEDRESIPIDLLNDIMSLNSPGQITKVVRHGDYAYIAFVKSIQRQKLTESQRKSLSKYIRTTLEQSYISDIITYLKNINQVTIYKNLFTEFNNND